MSMKGKTAIRIKKIIYLFFRRIPSAVAKKFLKLINKLSKNQVFNLRRLLMENQATGRYKIL